MRGGGEFRQQPGQRDLEAHARLAELGDLVVASGTFALGDQAALTVASGTVVSADRVIVNDSFASTGGGLPVAAITIAGQLRVNGNGTITRNETVTVRLAGVITQVLPNGNLVVSARQEVRVNSELRDLQVTGVIRSQDIASDNTVLHDRLAEARITYGGRGQLTDVQTPRYGQQLLDILLPF